MSTYCLWKMSLPGLLQKIDALVQRTFCACTCARGEQHGAFSLSPQGFLEEVLARGSFTSWADRGTPGPCSACMDADREGRGAGQQKGISVVGSAVLGRQPKGIHVIWGDWTCLRVSKAHTHAVPQASTPGRWRRLWKDHGLLSRTSRDPRFSILDGSLP